MSAATRLLGVDYGKRADRFGDQRSRPQDRVSAGDASARQPRTGGRLLSPDLIAEESVGGIVLGLPVHCDGKEGQAAAAVRAFGQWLGELTGLPLVYWDERFTTVEAEAALWDAGLTHKQRKQRRDKVAAQMLLQAYLDAGCPADPKAGPLDG